MTADPGDREDRIRLTELSGALSSYARLPPPVGAGDRVGIAALSGPIDGECLDCGLDALRDLGFEPVPAANLASRRGLFAGDDDERLEAFHRLAARPSVKAIFFARGGHGALRLLPLIDWSALAEVPRAYVGYSDLTVFLNLVVHRLGLVSFHGPMVAVELADGLAGEERDSLLGALGGELPVELEVEGLAPGGRGEGPLLGGCLSLLAATLGTRYAIPRGGSILFWEDVAEPLYRLDRMLTHLSLSGSLAAIEGMVVGRVDTPDDDPDGATLDHVLAGLQRGGGWPVARGAASGHCRPNLTLPLGLRARLDATAGLLTIG